MAGAARVAMAVARHGGVRRRRPADLLDVRLPLRVDAPSTGSDSPGGAEQNLRDHLHIALPEPGRGGVAANGRAPLEMRLHCVPV